MCKVVKGLASKIIKDLFSLKWTKNCKSRHKLFFKIPWNETGRDGFERISYLGPKILENCLQKWRNVRLLLAFKSKILEYHKLSL